MDIPGVIYDRETQIIYQENSDGSWYTSFDIGVNIERVKYIEITWLLLEFKLACVQF